MEHTTTTTTPRQGFNWNEYFTFRKMIALQIIQTLYIVVAALITLGGLVLMFRSDSYGYGYSSMLPGGFFTGLLFIIFGNIFWRLWCEFFMVLFRINRTLSCIDDNTKRP